MEYKPFYALLIGILISNTCCATDQGYKEGGIYSSVRFNKSSEVVQVPVSSSQFSKLNVSPNLNSFREPKKRDARSTVYAICFTFDMWEKALKKLETNNQAWLNWENRADITVYPFVQGNTQNAFYNPKDKSLNFYYSPNSFYMCRSFDTVAHESGHAFLDAILPIYNQPINGEHSISRDAMHEAFGDISAIMASIEVALVENKFQEVDQFLRVDDIGDLAVRGPTGSCIRNAADHVGHVTTQMHDLSKPFTQAFF